MRHKLLAGAAVVLVLAGCGGGGSGGGGVTSAASMPKAKPAPVETPEPAPVEISHGWTKPTSLLGWEYRVEAYEHIGGRQVEAKYGGDGYFANPPANLTFNGAWHGKHSSGATRTGNVWVQTSALYPGSTILADVVEFDARFTGGGVNERFDNVRVSDDGEFIDGTYSRHDSARHIDGGFVRDGNTWKVGGEFRADGVFGAFGAKN